jgi:hypothetical protein
VIRAGGDGGGSILAGEVFRGEEELVDARLFGQKSGQK